jgi:hypothetical protein
LPPENKNLHSLAKPAEIVYCFSEILSNLAYAFPGAAISGFGAADDSLIPPQTFEIAQNGLVNNGPALLGGEWTAGNSCSPKKELSEHSKSCTKAHLKP